MQGQNAPDGQRPPGAVNSAEEEIDLCDRYIAEMRDQMECPAWLVTLGIEDWEMEKRLIRRAAGLALLVALLIPSAIAQSAPVNPGAGIWKASLAALAAGHAMDAHSSWRFTEANFMLAGRDGNFGHRSIAIKTAFAGASALAQYLTIRFAPHDRREGLRRRFARVNFFVGGALGGVAVSNYARRAQ